MLVATLPIVTDVALVEYALNADQCPVLALVFRDGLLPDAVIKVLQMILRAI